MKLEGRLLLDDMHPQNVVPEMERTAEDPSLETEDGDVSDTDLENLDEADSVETNEQRADSKNNDFRVPILVGVALVALSAIYVTVRRLLNSHIFSTHRRERHPKRAFVRRTQFPASHKTGLQHLSPDSNLSFVVPEDFKLITDDTTNLREPWQRSLSFVPDSSTLVHQLEGAGATCIGKAHTESNPFRFVESVDHIFRNPEQLGSITGGEYSGCGVLVRAGLADFAIATDSIGSVRVAAACCGVIGFRATYGSTPLDGIALKSDGLDSAAFMVKKSKYLSKIGSMLELPGAKNTRGKVIKILLARDMFRQWLENDGKEMLFAVAKAALKWGGEGNVEEVDLGDFLHHHAIGWKDFATDEEEEDVFDALRQIQIIISGYELKCKLMKDCNMSKESSAEEIVKYEKALVVKKNIQAAFKKGMVDSQIIITPGLLTSPPSRNASEEALECFELETQRLCVLSTLVGCPQVCFPIHDKHGNVFSISMLSLNKSDKELLYVSESLIPLTKQMLEAELLQERHQRHLTPTQSNGAPVSEREFESERWREIGNHCYSEGKFDEAVVAYTEAINRCPHKAVYYNNRAMAHIKLGSFIFAEDDCIKAIGLEPNNPKALLRRGVARKALGKLIEAGEDFTQVLRLEPNNRKAQTELMSLHRVFNRD